jgi:hypothetical protein
MRIRSVVLGALVLTAISLTLSYLKFARCVESGWISPAVYQLGCYTDITALYDIRGFAKDIWPYGVGSDSLEYPILTGLGIWLIALVTKDSGAGLQHFFLLNIIALSLCFGYLIHLIAKIERKSAVLMALSPAVVSALFINWDIWSITSLIAGLYFLNNRRYGLSGVLISISIFLKFFPIIFLIPIAILLWRNGRESFQFFRSFALSALIFNLPFIFADIDGWAKFYIFNYQRGVDFGSIWYVISLKGNWISELNWIATPLVLALLLLVYFRYRTSLLGSIYLVSVIFFTLNKVYSPQYVLWLTVITLLFFPKTKIFYLLFALWQTSELGYQVAIWRHLLEILNQPGGIGADIYVVITLLRILTLLLMAGYALYLLENHFIKRGSGESNLQTDLFAHLGWRARLHKE